MTNIFEPSLLNASPCTFASSVIKEKFLTNLAPSISFPSIPESTTIELAALYTANFCSPGNISSRVTPSTLTVIFPLVKVVVSTVTDAIPEVV